jgi:hypothetical protein
LHTAF